MYLYILLIINFLLFMINYWLAKKDCFSPSVMTFISLIAGNIFLVIAKETWDVEVSLNTLIICFFGGLAITFGNALSNPIRNRVKNNGSYVLTYKRKYIIFASIISVLLTVLYGINAYKVGVMAGGSGLNAFGYMKALYLNQEQGPKMNLLIRQGFKLVMAIAYVNGFYLINNLINRKKERNSSNYFFCISIGAAVCITIFSGSRTEIIRLLSSIMIIFAVVWREKHGWKFPRTNKKVVEVMIKRFFIPVLMFVLLAFASRVMVKTNNVATSRIDSILGYVTFYVGSPFAVLNNKINMAFSENSFMIANNISKSIAGSHTYLGRLDYGGNVSTIYCIVLSNGLLLMVLRLILVYCLFETMYKSLFVGSNTSRKRDACLLFFSMIYYVFIEAFYSYNVRVAMDFSSTIIIAIALLYFYVTSIYKKSFSVPYSLIDKHQHSIMSYTHPRYHLWNDK